MSTLFDALLGLRNLLHGNLIFGVGALLLAGFVGGKLATRLRLPTISGYVVAGLLLASGVAYGSARAVAWEERRREAGGLGANWSMIRFGKAESDATSIDEPASR